MIRFPNETHEYLPLRLVADDIDMRFRFGGRPPAGIRPRHPEPFTCLLVTLPVSSEIFCSVFLNVTYDDSKSPHFVLAPVGEIQGEDSKFVEIHWHGSVPEVEVKDDLPQCLPLLGFKAGAKAFDPIAEGGVLPHGDECNDEHKIGGYPNFYQPSDLVVPAVQGLIDAGYRHHFQLSFPGLSDCSVPFAWPFGQYVFHLFIRETDGRFEGRVTWS